MLTLGKMLVHSSLVKRLLHTLPRVYNTVMNSWLYQNLLQGGFVWIDIMTTCM